MKSCQSQLSVKVQNVCPIVPTWKKKKSQQEVEERKVECEGFLPDSMGRSSIFATFLLYFCGAHSWALQK